MPKKKSHGGPREGSGRKPVEDRMVPVTFYVRKSIMDKLGPIEIKGIASRAVIRNFNKKK